jgi:hypothetical protein
MWSKRWLYAALGVALALPWVTGTLQAQELPAADPEPSVLVPPPPAPLR